MPKTNTQKKARSAPPKQAGPPQRRVVQVGRNEICPCGSGKKYKHCHEAEGQAFLAKLTYQREKEEKLRRLKEEGAPWYRRLFAAAN